MSGFRGGPSSALLKMAVYNNMEALSLLGAAASLEFTILFLGAALFLDYRRAVRTRWLRRHLETMLQGNPRPVLVDLPDAA